MNEICQHEPYLSEDKLAVIEAAKDRGLVVFDFTEAVGRILTLDLDKGFYEFRNQVMESPDFRTRWTFTISKSERYHGFVVISAADDIPCGWTAHYQKALALGSDPIREKAAFENLPNLGSYLMFETQEDAPVLRRWLKTLPEGLQKLVKEL